MFRNFENSDGNIPFSLKNCQELSIPKIFGKLPALSVGQLKVPLWCCQWYQVVAIKSWLTEAEITTNGCCFLHLAFMQKWDEHCLKCAPKYCGYPHFKVCFFFNPVESRTRSPLIYKEKTARTKRLLNSPMHHKRSTLASRFECLASFLTRIFNNIGKCAQRFIFSNCFHALYTHSMYLRGFIFISIFEKESNNGCLMNCVHKRLYT